MSPRCLIAVAALVLAVPLPAAAQFAGVRGTGQQTQPASRDQPVTFTADAVQYDRDKGIVTATGHVEAWQNDHVLQADRITFDRNTNVAAASGHVVLVEPDGQVLFSDYTELTQGMRDAVLRGMRALLAENGKLVANGARRTGGDINELSRGVYTTCDLCAKNPSAPPLWQIRARTMTEDLVNKRIEYHDAFLDMYGIPVMYFPYFSNADPSVKRASGFLVPSIGSASHIGAFATIPYYWVIDPQSDATFAPTLATSAGPNLDTQYRRRFNDGTLSVNASLGYDQSQPQAAIFAKGRFAYDENWRYGFDIDRASSETYMRDFHISGWQDILTSQIYAEGFGQGAYSKIDARAYQGLASSVDQAELPYVLPRYEYSFFGEPDALGGRFSLDVNSFNVLREIGTNTQRAGGSANWERPFRGQLGDLWNVTLHLDAASYVANDLNKQPNYSTVASDATARAQPTGAVMVRWPLLRTASMGSQLIEPIAQLVVGPNTGSSGANKYIPNEDSLDFEFTDANLFALNKFPGIDRLEGGVRANVGLHTNWTWNGTVFDGLIGQSYRLHKDDTFPVGSGLEDNTSDIVARASLSPTSWLDLTSRFRLDHENLNVHFAEGVASVGQDIFRVNGGYIYSNTDPYYLYTTPTPPPQFFTPRNEITLSAASHIGNWRFSAYGRRDLENSQMISAGVHATYEDECFIFDAHFDRRYTSIDGDHGASYLLFSLTFKTVGQFGFNAL